MSLGRPAGKGTEKRRGRASPPASGGEADWTPAERRLLASLDTPEKVQLFLNRLAYDPAPGTASPRRVLRERKANCFEGALLAAAAFRHHGRPPLLVDMRSWNDDDHVLAVFRHNGAWGAASPNRITPFSAFGSPSTGRSGS